MEFTVSRTQMAQNFGYTEQDMKMYEMNGYIVPDYGTRGYSLNQLNNALLQRPITKRLVLGFCMTGETKEAYPMSKQISSVEKYCSKLTPDYGIIAKQSDGINYKNDVDEIFHLAYTGILDTIVVTSLEIFHSNILPYIQSTCEEHNIKIISLARK